MNKPKPKPPAKAALSPVKLVFPPADLERLRVVAAASPHKNMAHFARAVVLNAIDQAERKASR